MNILAKNNTALPGVEAFDVVSDRGFAHGQFAEAHGPNVDRVSGGQRGAASGAHDQVIGYWARFLQRGAVGRNLLSTSHLE